MLRAKITVSLPIDIIEWLNAKVKDGTFPNVSAGVERCIKKTRERNYHD
ncbi:MAG: hypothetical protein H3Z53_11445 [archaeon]|nr:hypothetical protein [archaeon]